MRTFESLMDDLNTGKYIQNIGQIDKESQRQLAKLVRKGVLKRFKMGWLGIYSPLKTTWMLNSN